MRIAAAFLIGLLSICAHAQTYPAKTVRILVGFAPGGSTDLTARIFAQELNKLWGAQVVVDNRPGASGMIAAELAAKAPPDGYTWLVSPQTSIVVAPLIYKKVGYDPVRDFAPIAVIGSTPQLLVLHPSLPPRTFREFTRFRQSQREERSRSARAASARRRTWRASSSTRRSRCASRTCRTKAKTPASSICSADRSRTCSRTSRWCCRTSRPGSCARSRSRACSARRSRRNIRPSPNRASPVSTPRRGAASTCRRRRRASS